MLPAGNGDAFWIEYGDAVKPRRILIDGGVRRTREYLQRRIEALPQRRFDLIVLTHVDGDHIDGLLSLFEMSNPGFKVADFWMNGWKHLAPADVLGAKQGEMLTRIIKHRKLPWNQAFQGNAIVAPEVGAPPLISLPDGLQVTILSPYQQHLIRLIPAWEDALASLKTSATEEASPEEPDLLGGDLNPDKLAAEAFREDCAIPNGSSIALLLEYHGLAFLFAGDAHPSTLTFSIRQLLHARRQQRLKLTAFKVSHHGSAANTNKELLQLLDCPRFLFATDGSGRQKHPNPQTIARILCFNSTPTKQLVFNYRSSQNALWDEPGLKEKYGYTTCYAEPGTPATLLW